MTAEPTGEPLGRLAGAYAAAREQAARAIVGQEATFELLFAALLAGGHVLLEGVPGTAKTLLAQTLAALVAGTFRRVQFTAGPDAVRRRRHHDLRSAGRRVPLPGRPGLLPRPAGRRGQPRARQDPGRPAGGDGGAPRDGRRRGPPAARPVPGDRDPEPRRVRGDVPAAGGPARPLHVQAGRRLRLGGGRARGRAAPPGRLRAEPPRIDWPPGRPEPGRPAGLPGRPRPRRHRAGRAGLHRRDRPGDPPQRRRPAWEQRARAAGAGARRPGRWRRCAVGRTSPRTTSRSWSGRRCGTGSS